MSVSNANIKASGEIAVTPLINRVRGSSSASSNSTKEAFKGHDTINQQPGTGHGIDPSKHNATFEKYGDESYYTPIDSYEGKHRYDPKFEWEPHEERKLVRKVCKQSNKTSNKRNESPNTHVAGLPHLFLGLPDVLRPPTRPGQHHPGPLRQPAQRSQHEHRRLQHRADNLLHLLPLRRTALPAHLQKAWARPMDPRANGVLEPRRQPASLPQRAGLLLRLYVILSKQMFSYRIVLRVVRHLARAVCSLDMSHSSSLSRK